MDPYETLNVSWNASEKEIKAAYKKLALKFHPDKCQNSSCEMERFLRIKKAYEVLLAERARRRYDGVIEEDGRGRFFPANDRDLLKQLLSSSRSNFFGQRNGTCGGLDQLEHQFVQAELAKLCLFDTSGHYVPRTETNSDVLFRVAGMAVNFFEWIIFNSPNK